MSKASKLKAAGVAEDILALEAGALRALMPAMQAARRELERDLKAWLLKVAPGAAETYSIAHIRQLLLLLGVAEQQGKRRKASFGVVTGRALKEVLGQAHAPQQAIKTLIRHMDAIGFNFQDIPPPQILQAAWVAEGSRMAINQHANSAARYSFNVRADMQRQFAIGLLKGETIGQLTARIASISTFKAMVDTSTAGGAASAMAGGLSTRYAYWAERTVRTELVTSYNAMASEGIQRFHRLDDRVVSVWDSSNDPRRCAVCSSLHGKQATPGGAFPGGYRYPPAHPCCRCAVVAWIEEDWAEDRLLPRPEYP